MLYSLCRQIYLKGPGILGCWEGQTIEDVCSHLTRTSAGMWHSQMDTCVEIIDRKVVAHCIGIMIVLSIIVVYHVGSTYYQYYMTKQLLFSMNIIPKHQSICPVTTNSIDIH